MENTKGQKITPTAMPVNVMPFSATGGGAVYGVNADIMVDISEEAQGHGFTLPMFLREDAFNELIALETDDILATSEDRLEGLLLGLQDALLGIRISTFTMQFSAMVRVSPTIRVPVPVIVRQGGLYFDTLRRGIVLAIDYSQE